jgi:hypothetical protein
MLDARGVAKRVAMLTGASAGRTFVAATGPRRIQAPWRTVRNMKNSVNATSGMSSQGHTAVKRSSGERRSDACLDIGVSANKSP